MQLKISKVTLSFVICAVKFIPFILLLIGLDSI